MNRNYAKLIAIGICGLFTLIGVGLCAYIYSYNTAITKINIDEIEFVVDKNMYQYEIEEIEEDSVSFYVSGYALKLETPMEQVANVIVIYDSVKDCYYELPTEWEERVDITERVDDGFDYNNAGMASIVMKKYLDVGVEYPVFILFESNDEWVLLPTDTVLKGE